MILTKLKYNQIFLKVDLFITVSSTLILADRYYNNILFYIFAWTWFLFSNPRFYCLNSGGIMVFAWVCGYSDIFTKCNKSIVS